MKVIRRAALASLAVGALALTLAACTDSKATTKSTLPAPTAEIQSLKGMGTSVDLDPATAAVVQQNGVSVAPVGPATAATQNGMTVVSFPITAGYVALYPETTLPFVRGIVTHSGDLTFSADGVVHIVAAAA